MNKFKKACEELAGYLNKDAKGVELLSRVTRIGNEVRNELASAIDAKARLDSTCEHHMEIAAKAASELSNAISERQQHLDTIASLRSKVANYEKQATKDEEKGYSSSTLEITPKEVSRLVRDAINDKQHMCKVSTISMDEFRDGIGGTAQPESIALQDSIKNLSYAELAKLGRLVAIYAIMQGSFVVTSTRFSALYDPNKPQTESIEATNRLFMKFMKPRCDFSKDFRMQAKLAGSKSQPPKATTSGWCKEVSKP